MKKAIKMAQKGKSENFNEFYTLYEQAELVLMPLYDKFKDKKICCPCDSNDSNIVKWLKDNGCDVINFGDLDVNGEEARSIMDACDFVITNPPFSWKIFRPFIHYLIDAKKDFIVWGPFLRDEYLLNNAYTYSPVKAHMHKYLFIDGTYKYANTCFYTSFEPPFRYPCKNFYDGRIAITSVDKFSKDDYYFVDDKEYAGEHHSFIRIKLIPKK